MRITHNKSHLAKMHIDFANKISAPLQKTVRQGFKLTEVEYNKLYLFQLEFNYYQTNLDTDFIFDADVNSIVTFETDNALPTTKELYEIYCIVNRQANGLMLQASRDNYNIKTDISFDNADYNHIEGQLKTAIQDVLAD